MDTHIYTKNNAREAALLRKKLDPFDFTAFSKEEIKSLIQTMRVAMKTAEGIGLAANQIGFSFQVFVAQTEGKFYAIFNPHIEKTFGPLIEMEEACLSVPGFYGITRRYEKVLLTGQDQNGKNIKIKAWGLLAHVFQHETDHLNGKLYIDHALRLYAHPETERLQDREKKLQS